MGTPSVRSDQEAASPRPAKLVRELDALRRQAREQLEAVRGTIEKLDALRARIERR